MSFRRLNFNISTGSYKVLRSIKERTGKTLSEIVRDAIKLYTWAHAEDAAGKIIVSRKEGLEPQNGETRIII